MKRLAVAIVILMLGIMPTAAQVASTQPIRGAELAAMVSEILEWIAQNTEYSVSGSPRVVFVDQAVATATENDTKREGGITAWDRNSTYKFGGLYDSTTKTVYLRDDWGGHTSFDWGVITHELVHYVQIEADRKFECLEDEELEAYILSFDLINDRFGNHWPDAARNLRATRREQNACTPPSIPAAET